MQLSLKSKGFSSGAHIPHSSHTVASAPYLHVSLLRLIYVQLLFTSSQPILDSTSNTRKEETFLRKPSGFHFQQICGTNTWELIGYLMLCLPRVDMHYFLGPWCSGSVKST